MASLLICSLLFAFAIALPKTDLQTFRPFTGFETIPSFTGRPPRVTFTIIPFTFPPINLCLGENEVWDQCGGLCEPNCDNPFPKCIPVCAIHGRCVCKPGFYRSSSNGNCIKGEDCYADNNPCNRMAPCPPCQVCVVRIFPCPKPNPTNAPWIKFPYCAEESCLHED